MAGFHSETGTLLGIHRFSIRGVFFQAMYQQIGNLYQVTVELIIYESEILKTMARTLLSDFLP